MSLSQDVAGCCAEYTINGESNKNAFSATLCYYWYIYFFFLRPGSIAITTAALYTILSPRPQPRPLRENRISAAQRTPALTAQWPQKPEFVSVPVVSTSLPPLQRSPGQMYARPPGNGSSRAAASLTNDEGRPAAARWITPGSHYYYDYYW